MSKVLTFSRYFPAYHPKAGQETNFVEKILISLDAERSYYPVQCEKCERLMMSYCMNVSGIADTGDYDTHCSFCGGDDFVDFDGVTEDYYNKKFQPKHHTIRAGHRFKAGDKFSPRVWSGKPYRSKQIIIAPDIEVVKTWDFEMIGINWDTEYSEIMMSIDGQERMNPVLLATNDGLTYDDFYRWFTLSADFKKTKVFSGQIIAWNENINY